MNESWRWLTDTTANEDAADRVAEDMARRQENEGGGDDDRDR